MADTLRLNFAWHEHWPDQQLLRLLPSELSFGPHLISFIAPWKLRHFENLVRIQGQINVIYQWKRGIQLKAQLVITAAVKPRSFPNVQIELEELRLINKPKVKVLGISIPVKRQAERMLQKQKPQLEKRLNATIQQKIDSELLLLPERISKRMPPGILVSFNGMLWRIFAQHQPVLLELDPLLNIESLEDKGSEGKLDLTLPFNQEPSPLALKYHISAYQLNNLLQGKINGMTFDTPAGEFIVRQVQAEVYEQHIQILVDFNKEKNGQIVLKGYPKILEDDIGICLVIDDVDWKGVSIVKKGLFRLFEKMIRKKMNESLSIDKMRLSKLIEDQIESRGNEILEPNSGKIKSVNLDPQIRKIELQNDGILVMTNLAGAISIEFDQMKHE